MKEIYKEITGYPNYQASNLGNIKSMKKGFVLSPIETKAGYYIVNLYQDKKRKTMYVHQLICMAFLGFIPDGHRLECDHIDNDKANNRLDNLRLLSHRENSARYHDDNKNNTSTYRGVHYNKAGRRHWKAQAGFDGESYYLGCYYTEIEAAAAYIKAVRNFENKGYHERK